MRRTSLGRWPASLLGAAALAVAWCGASAAKLQYEGDPATSNGDIRFHARAVAYRQGSHEARAEFTIRVPYREIRFVQEGDLYAAKLRITVELWNASQKRSGYMQREAILQSTDYSATVDSLLGEVYALGLTAPPGKYTFRVLVEDMNVERMGLVYKMKNQMKQGEVDGAMDMGDWLFKNPALSGVEFAWSVTGATEGSPFRKGSYDVQPQPSAYYGNFQDAVSVYYEIYDDPPPPEGREFLLSTRVFGAEGDTVFTASDSLRVTEGGAWPHAPAIDVSEFRAGHYKMVLTLEDGSGRRLAQTQGEFDVLWSLDSWSADAVDFYEATATTLLTSDSLLIFRELSMGEKERWVERLWRKADPTPDTGDNESREEFRRRVSVANVRYSGFERGMFSDRGRVYVRYGEPDELTIERIPVGESTLGHAVQDTQIPAPTREKISNTQTGLADERPYEIWTYDSRGHELLERYSANDRVAGLKFVFVDEQGNGEYTLKYSSTSAIH
ncbi:MAG: GWxTD domain-containing protein [Candidatus Eiseniibacteriota bacterium]